MASTQMVLRGMQQKTCLLGQLDKTGRLDNEPIQATVWPFQACRLLAAVSLVGLWLLVQLQQRGSSPLLPPPLITGQQGTTNGQKSHTPLCVSDHS